MRAVRFLLASAIVATVGLSAVSSAGAVGFADQPCPVSGPGGIRVCPAGVVGQNYTVTLAGSGGCGPALPYQYRVLNGELPPGVSLSRKGVLSGVPTRGGDWDFWVELSDQDPPTASWCVPRRSQREFLIHVGAPAATVGVPYSFALGATSQTWSLVAGVLPPGLVLDPASGVIAGTPEVAGTYPLTFSAPSSGGKTTTLSFTLTVYPVLSFATEHLVPVRVGHLLRARVRTTGGVGPVKLRVVSGRFPIGVRLHGTEGVLQGRPRQRGVYRFSLEAQDSLGRTTTRPFVLLVRPR